MPEDRLSFSNRVWNIYGNSSIRTQDSCLSIVGTNIMNNRGFRSQQEIDNFLFAKLKSTIVDPFVLNDMEAATKRICKAIVGREKILVFGDYDVDGVTSTCILVSFLREFGCSPKYFLPNRFTCGYGFNDKSLEYIESDVDLVIIVDSGINSVDSIKKVQNIGVDVVVCDHHLQINDTLPDAVAVVDPNRKDQQDSTGNLKNLCAAGLVFLLMIAIRREMSRYDLDLHKYIHIAALGTLCDVMKLTPLNRAIVKYALTSNEYPVGLRAMLSLYGIDTIRTADDLTFFIGPLINAAGRIEDPTLALEILLSDDYDFALRQSRILYELNRIRKDIEKKITIEAIDIVESSQINNNAICVYGDGWNDGVIGIIAGKLKEKYQKPSFVISFDGERGKGSARSINGVNLEILFRKSIECGVLDKGGGHAMAGGFEVRRDNLNAFEKFLEANCMYEHINVLDVDYTLTLDSDFTRVAQDLKVLEPFGNGFSKPLFLFVGVVISYSKISNNERHISLYLKSVCGSNSIRAMIFNISSKKNIVDGVIANYDAIFDIVGYLNFSPEYGTSIIVEDMRLSV